MFGRLAAVFAVAALAWSGAAHGEATKSKKGPNGGTEVSVSGHPIEFVYKDVDIIFYIRDDDGSPLQTKGMKGRAVVQDGGKTTTVQLSAAPPNRLVGKLQSALGPKARIVMSTAFSAGGHSHTLQARFVAD
jgi:hypothetical protein